MSAWQQVVLGQGWRRTDYGTQAVALPNKLYNDRNVDYSGVWRAPWSEQPGYFTVYSPYPSSTVHLLSKDAVGSTPEQLYLYVDAPGLSPWSPGDAARVEKPYGASEMPGPSDGTWIGNNWWWIALTLGLGSLAYYHFSKGRR